MYVRWLKQIKQGVTIIRVVTARAVGVQITSLDFKRLIFRRGDHNLNTAVTSSDPLSLIYICTRSKTGMQRWRLRAADSWWVPYPGKVHEYLGDLYILIGKRQTLRVHLTPTKYLLFIWDRTTKFTYYLLVIKNSEGDVFQWAQTSSLWEHWTPLFQTV